MWTISNQVILSRKYVLSQITEDSLTLEGVLKFGMKQPSILSIHRKQKAQKGGMLLCLWQSSERGICYPIWC